MTSLFSQRFGVAALAALGVLAAQAEAQDYENTPIAVLVTEAKLGEYGRGKVLGWFPAAAIAREPVRRNRGILVLDTDEQRFERAQVPLTAQFQRGEQEFDEGQKKLRTVRESTLSYSVAPDAFLGKLGTLVAEAKEALPTGLVPTTPFEKLEGFTETTPRRWYLRPAKGADKKTFDPDVPQSVVIDLGNRNALEKLRDTFTKDPVAGAVAVYQHHYVDQPVTLHLYRLRAGANATHARTVSGVHFVRHRDATAAGGRIVVPQGEGTPDWTASIERLELKDGGASVTVAAATMLDSLVAPALRGDAAKAPKLECVVPEDGDAASPCVVGKDGQARIEGSLAPDKPLTFVVEKKIEGNDPNAFATLYRIELHWGANAPKRKE